MVALLGFSRVCYAHQGVLNNIGLLRCRLKIPATTFIVAGLNH